MNNKNTHILTQENFAWLSLKIEKGDRVFLRGDLWAGKTTLSKYIISSLLGTETAVRSPTYTYYNKYGNIYHFDLYRLQSYDDFINIGWEEILDNPLNICLIEWPEILEGKYEPTVDIELLKTENENEREVRVEVRD